MLREVCIDVQSDGLSPLRKHIFQPIPSFFKKNKKMRVPNQGDKIASQGFGKGEYARALPPYISFVDARAHVLVSKL